MRYTDFEKRYRAAEEGFQTVAADLRSILEQALDALDDERKEKGLSPHIMRFRLHEARHKECDSLYRKIINDTTLDPEDALLMGHVRDLIGARIVCHTLEDVKYLGESIKKDAFRGLHYVEPRKGAKDWSETPNSDSGYRGHHLDVKWPRGKDGFNCAELQLRTLLQDAWASLFHSDLYKGPAGVLPTDIHSKARALSDKLHELDEVAQSILRDIANQKLRGAGRIKMLEAIEKEMYAMAAVGASDMAVSPYSRVHRKDRYVIGPEPLFDFTFEGDCRKQAPFNFLIAGDTPNSQMAIDSVEYINEKGSAIPLSATQYDVIRSAQPNRVVTLTRPAWKGKHHHYHIVCRWAGVFNLSPTYIWCPWATMYRHAEMVHQLSLEFLRRPSLVPKIFFVEQLESVDSAFQAYTDGSGESGEYSYGKKTRRHIYRFEPKESGDMLCFFMV